MTYDAFASSREQSRPIELFRFVQGGNTFEYTSAEDSLTVASITYDPEIIRRGRIAQSPRDRNSTLEIRVPITNTFARRYRASVPGARASITIQRVQRLDFPTPQAITIFTGYVGSVAFENEMKEAVIACKPIESASSRPVPRFSYQSLCNHVLFDNACKVDDTDPRWRLTQTVSAQTGATLTVPGAGAFGADWWVGGFLEINGGDDARLIVGQSGDDLQLLLPFPSSSVGQSVTVFAGCDHTITTCDTKFDTTEDTLSNVINYGGFAFVPTRNPYQTGLQ
jgi:uncharacterized phage protein (TIGR02218 family)